MASLFSEKLFSEQPERIAVVNGADSCTYGQLHAGVAALAQKLREMGVTRGSRVALWGYNSVNWLIAFFAIARAGGAAMLVNYSTGCEEAAELLKMTGTGFLLCGDNAQTKRGVPAMENLAALAGIPTEHCLDIRPAAVTLSALTPSGKTDDARTEAEAKETAFIIFTSGTTSKPKAVQLSQYALSFDADAFNRNLGIHAGESICVAVPLFHILGLLMSYAYLCRGATVYLPVNNKAETLVREIGTHRVCDMAAVGAVYLALAEADGFEENVAENLHLCMIAGGMSTPVQMMRLELDFTNATFLNMYGQSEAAPLTMVSPEDLVEQRAQSVGRPVPGLDIRILSATGDFLPQGEIGEVVAKGPNLMNGYDGLPPEKQAIDANGWLHTGDLGFFDEDGFLHLAGRIKDLIIRGGENISPSEIESALNRLDNVREAKVMGAPHPIYGESVEACITRQDSKLDFDAEALKTALRSTLPRYKIPSHIFCYDRFPLNVNGKLDQRSLHADLIKRLLRLSVDEELSGGVTVFDLVVKNSRYAIVPVTSLVGELAADIGFSKRRVLSMTLAVEEMLTERILDAYSAAGDIRVRISLMPEWLRVAFSDNGAEYFIDKRRDTSMSAKIILKAVSDFHTDYLKGKPVYCMDFLYEKEINIEDFLMKNKGEDER